MKVLLTGANGFIGSYLAKALIEGDHTVYGVIQEETPLVNGYVPITMDLADSGDYARLPRQIDAVVHLAQGTPGQFPDGNENLFAINTMATDRLARYALKAGAELVLFSSTGNVYRPGLNPYRETDPLWYDTPDPYYLSKVMAERLLDIYRNKSDLAIAIVRLFVPYGPGQVKRMIPALLERVQRQQPVTLTNGGEPWVNPIHISDVTRQLMGLIERKKAAVVNIAGNEHISVKDLILLMSEVVGIDAPPFSEVSSPQQFNLLGRNDEVIDMTGITPAIDLRTGLAQMVAAQAAV